MTGPLTLLMAMSLGAPVPKAPEPDPLAWAYLGVRVQQGSLTLSSVEPNGPALQAGLQPGDEITAVGTLTKVTNFDDVGEHISTFRPGSWMTVIVNRKGEKKSFKVKLGVRPAELGIPPNKNRLPIPEDPKP